MMKLKKECEDEDIHFCEYGLEDGVQTYFDYNGTFDFNMVLST